MEAAIAGAAAVMAPSDAPAAAPVRLSCYDPVDSTSCLQTALNSKARYIVIPNTGSPWISEPLFANSSDMVVSLESGVVIEAKRGKFHGPFRNSRKH